MNYKCNFPGCDYETEHRTQIESHHIEQQSDGGSNKEFNRVFLCPNHHARIYVPTASSSSKHSIKGDDSIILKRWLQCTFGSRVLEYEDMSGSIEYIEDKNATTT